MKHGRRRNLCSICRLNPAVSAWCKPCLRSYDRAIANDDGTVDAALEWVARRSWRYAVISVEAQRAADALESLMILRGGVQE